MSVNKYNASTGELTNLASGSRIWTGSEAAYKAEKTAGTLPTNALIMITDDEVDTSHYSTDETFTGMYWIDGKKIYRKVFLCTSQATIPSAGSAWATVPGWNTTGINVETITYWDTPTVGTGKNLYHQAGITGLNGQWACISNATTIAVGTPLIVEYTKITDD